MLLKRIPLVLLMCFASSLGDDYRDEVYIAIDSRMGSHSEFAIKIEEALAANSDMIDNYIEKGLKFYAIHYNGQSSQLPRNHAVGVKTLPMFRISKALKSSSEIMPFVRNAPEKSTDYTSLLDKDIFRELLSFRNMSKANHLMAFNYEMVGSYLEGEIAETTAALVSSGLVMNVYARNCDFINIRRMAEETKGTFTCSIEELDRLVGLWQYHLDTRRKTVDYVVKKEGGKDLIDFQAPKEAEGFMVELMALDDISRLNDLPWLYPDDEPQVSVQTHTTETLIFWDWPEWKSLHLAVFTLTRAGIRISVFI